MDHCYLAGKTSESPTLQIEADGTPNRHRIDHNHFGPRSPLGRNGGETIRVGYSGQSMNVSATLVEQNLFERCDGELEIISNKSCENIYRGNTFLDCAGMLTLRHGNRCLVEGNFFFARNKKGSGGIRVIGEDHTVINNYIDGVERMRSGSPRAFPIRRSSATSRRATAPSRSTPFVARPRRLPRFERRPGHRRSHAASGKHHDRQQSVHGRPEGSLLKGMKASVRMAGNIASAGAGLPSMPVSARWIPALLSEPMESGGPAPERRHRGAEGDCAGQNRHRWPTENWKLRCWMRSTLYCSHHEPPLALERDGALLDGAPSAGSKLVSSIALRHSKHRRPMLATRDFLRLANNSHEGVIVFVCPRGSERFKYSYSFM